jgi:hypothetical protein
LKTITLALFLLAMFAAPFMGTAQGGPSLRAHRVATDKADNYEGAVPERRLVNCKNSCNFYKAKQKTGNASCFTRCGNKPKKQKSICRKKCAEARNKVRICMKKKKKC